MYIAVLCIIILLLATKGIRDEGTVSLQGDMPRYLMNGTYFYDFISDLPLFHPIKYTYHYFARYPALSLGHHPVLLSAAEVPLYAIFGISVFSGRLTIICFMLLGGIGWFLVIKSIYTENIAFFSSLLFVTTPFIVHFSRIVLSEIPALALIIAAIYFLFQYYQRNKNTYLYAFVSTLLLSIFARYQAILMVPIFLGYVLVAKKPKNFITRKTLFACLLGVLFLLPLIFIILKYSQTNIHWLTQKSFSSRIALSNILYHLHAIWKSHLTFPVFILSLCSICVSMYRRDTRTIFFLLWIIGYYFQITLIGANNAPRYSIYWIPAFCVFAAVPLNFFQARSWKILFSILLIMIAVYQFVIAFQADPEYAAGYEQAAKYVLEHRKGVSVLYSANIDSGYFVFFVRKHDPDREMIVLRADKLLVTSHLRWIVEERITRREQIYEILQDFGVGYVIIENKEYKSPPLIWLQEEVKSDKFILRKSIPILSNSSKLKEVTVNIYEYTEYISPKPGKVLRMNIPLMGDSIEVRLDDLL